MMRAIMLGSGTSSGVPRIGGDWGDCDPADRRNRRRRASIIVETATTRILVDTSPDMREQLLDADVAEVDAVIWTHDHADHCHGLDDLRQLYHARGAPVPGFAAAETLETLRGRFGYAFDGRDGYPATIDGRLLGADETIGDVRVRHVAMPHGSIVSAGLRFEHDGQAIGYATDFSDLTQEMAALFEGLDLWIVDALRRRPHPTHPHLAMTLAAIERCRPRRAVLTHMDQSMDYTILAAELPGGVEPGFDGLEMVVA